VRPCFLPTIPSPPPSVSPAIPTNAQVPAGRARPCSLSDADIRPSRVPGPTVATPPRDRYRSHRRHVDHEPTAHRASGEAMASTASHTPIRADLQKDQTGLPISINITAGADRKLPIPPPSDLARRTAVLAGRPIPTRTSQRRKRGQAGGTDPRHISPRGNSDHALDLPIDESFLADRARQHGQHAPDHPSLPRS
jgi:hypothetical protein